MTSSAATAPAEPAPVSNRLIGALLLGAAIALALGVYGNVHDPSQKLIFTLIFSSTIAMKVWLATIAVAFAVVQLLSALCLYGKLPVAAPPDWLGSVHRMSGR